VPPFYNRSRAVARRAQSDAELSRDLSDGAKRRLAEQFIAVGDSESESAKPARRGVLQLA